MIEIHLEDQSRPFFPHYKSSKKIKYDGFAPDGIDDLSGPTIIEVKLFRGKYSYVSLDHIILNLMREDSIENVLLIIGKNLTQNERNKILDHFPVSSINIKIWDLSDLIRLSDKYPPQSNSSIPELSESVLNETVSYSLNRSPDEWKENRDEYISRLKQSYKNDGLVLFLGSGISKDSGIPVWDDLLYELFVALIRDKLGNKMEFNESEERFYYGKIKGF